MPATARPGPLTVLPSGEKFEIRADGQRATIVEVGGGLREYAVDSRPVIEPYSVDRMRDGAQRPNCFEYVVQVGDRSGSARHRGGHPLEMLGDGLAALDPGGCPDPTAGRAGLPNRPRQQDERARGRWRATAHDPERHKLEGARAGHQNG